MQDLIISGKKRKPKINIHRSFESYWFQLFRGELAAFAAKFRVDISDIAIGADADMRPTIQNWNIDDRYKGRAYDGLERYRRMERNGAWWSVWRMASMPTPISTPLI